VEFERQLLQRIESHDLGKITIDAVDIGGEDLLLLWREESKLCVQFGVGEGLYACVAVSVDVGVEGAGPEDLRQAATSGTTEEFELPEAVLRDRVTIGFEQAAVGLGEDMRHAELIAVNAHLLATHIESGEPLLARAAHT